MQITLLKVYVTSGRLKCLKQKSLVPKCLDSKIFDPKYVSERIEDNTIGGVIQNKLYTSPFLTRFDPYPIHSRMWYPQYYTPEMFPPCSMTLHHFKSRLSTYIYLNVFSSCWPPEIYNFPL